MKKLTINDIAKLSGVGKSTVSRVLNNDPKVSATTREKVRKIIHSLDFQPSKSARAMRGIKHRTIGIIVTRLIFYILFFNVKFCQNPPHFLEI
ncbi:LacI family DNA-binding transcriptional regulator [[Haemophilus] felis]|nr:LacI family DNA-binding transcriptional regulator [[Haemophilus] felis]NBI41481.1 LacI family DNA-binding transcriptional regulator [[Haemophilus] felis]